MPRPAFSRAGASPDAESDRVVPYRFRARFPRLRVGAQRAKSVPRTLCRRPVDDQFAQLGAVRGRQSGYFLRDVPFLDSEAERSTPLIPVALDQFARAIRPEKPDRQRPWLRLRLPAGAYSRISKRLLNWS